MAQQLDDYGEQAIKILEEGMLIPKLVAYDDGGGTYTIAFGCTDGVYKGMSCTVEEAEAMFQKEIAKHVAAVNKTIKIPLKPCQFTTCVSFFFNEGQRQSFVNAVNSGDEQRIAKTMMQFVYVGKKVWPGLIVRRTKELQLWHGTFTDPAMTAKPPVVDVSDEVKADPVKTKPSRMTVAAVAGAAVSAVPALPLPAVPEAVTKSLENADAWKAIGEHTWTLSQSAASHPALSLAVGLSVLTVWLWPKPKGSA